MPPTSPTNIPITITLIISIFLLMIPPSSPACLYTSPSLGCLSCPTATPTLSYNITSSLYTCTSITHCSEINITTCILCTSPYHITSTSTCTLSEGCLTYSASTDLCTECYDTYLLESGTCYLKNIPYCITYSITSTILSCTECKYPVMNATNNCSISSTLCEVWDYTIMQCTTCPSNYIINSNGISCYMLILGCVEYLYDGTGCLLCKEGYYISSSTGTCVFGYSYGLVKELMEYSYTTSTGTYTQICLINTYTWSSNTTICASTGTTVDHCLTGSTAAAVYTCSECLPGYYLYNTSTCVECGIELEYCELCSSSVLCTLCKYGYYLLESTTTTTSTTSATSATTTSTSSSRCMPCSAYNCLHCTYTSSSLELSCLSCPLNYTLNKGTCIKCTSETAAYDIITQTCIECSEYLENCQFCIVTNDVNTSTTTYKYICRLCVYGYYYQSSTSTCVNITNSSTTVTLSLSIEESVEILNKSSINSYTEYTSLNIKELAAECSTVYGTDGYVCICTSAYISSLCEEYQYLPIVSTLTFSTYLEVEQYSRVMRMSAEFTTFDAVTQVTVDTLSVMSESAFYDYLSTYTYSINRYQNVSTVPVTKTLTSIYRIFKQAITNEEVFSDQKVTIIQGNGFYFKYVPKGIKADGTGEGDDGYVVAEGLGTTYATIFYVFFNRVKVEGIVTGTVYVYNGLSTLLTATNVTIKKTRYSTTNTGSAYLLQNGVTQSLTLSLSSGYYTITKFPLSLLTSASTTYIIGVTVAIASSSTTDSTDLYSSQRIENVFYSASWLYILFFVILYLIFIPMCALVDCCEAKGHLHKRVKQGERYDTEQQSKDNNNMHHAQSESEEELVIKIKYREFFPIYNVGNTPKPYRLAKVSLFIVNMQHIVTFLTLFYFKFESGHQVVAIVLVIPAYLCTVIMGYVTGTIFRVLPGNFKYLINAFSIGYWVLWIILMGIMSDTDSKEYWPFILAFSILSFVLDMIIDGLETLLMYFVIRQQVKQIELKGLYDCLSKWLSLRGYYEFDKLARRMDEEGAGESED